MKKVLLSHVSNKETVGEVTEVELSSASTWRNWYVDISFFHLVQETEHLTITSVSTDEYEFSAWNPWK